MKELQTVAGERRRKPWQTGNEFIGKLARRFFDGFGASDGTIVGWLPAEGDDEALWHMVHGDDADEEDLDETELAFAIANHRENRDEMTAEEREYAADLRRRRRRGGRRTRRRAAAAAAATTRTAMASATTTTTTTTTATTIATTVGRAFGRGKSRSGLSRGRKGLSREVVIAPASKRLWSSAGARAWVAALRPPKSAAAVALAVTALRQHCREFGVLREGKERGMLRSEKNFQMRSWYHAGAFSGSHPLADPKKGK